MVGERSGRPRGGSASSGAPRPTVQGRPGRSGRPPTSTPNRRRRRGRPRPSRRQLVLRWVVLLAVAGGVLFGVVVGLKVLFAAVGEAIANAATAASKPTPTETGPLRPVACTSAEVQIALAADASAYRPGRTATFDIGITHIGTLPCTLDAGNAGRQLIITSGEERIFSSGDCDAGSTPLLLAPGDEYPGSVSWSTNRSAPGCPAGLPALAAGSYQAVVTAGTVTSAPIAFTVG